MEPKLSEIKTRLKIAQNLMVGVDEHIAEHEKIANQIKSGMSKQEVLDNIPEYLPGTYEWVMDNFNV